MAISGVVIRLSLFILSFVLGSISGFTYAAELNFVYIGTPNLVRDDKVSLKVGENVNIARRDIGGALSFALNHEHVNFWVLARDYAAFAQTFHDAGVNVHDETASIKIHLLRIEDDLLPFINKKYPAEGRILHAFLTRATSDNADVIDKVTAKNFVSMMVLLRDNAQYYLDANVRRIDSGTSTTLPEFDEFRAPSRRFFYLEHPGTKNLLQKPLPASDFLQFLPRDTPAGSELPDHAKRLIFSIDEFKSRTWESDLRRILPHHYFYSLLNQKFDLSNYAWGRRDSEEVWMLYAPANKADFNLILPAYLTLGTTLLRYRCFSDKAVDEGRGVTREAYSTQKGNVISDIVASGLYTEKVDVFKTEEMESALENKEMQAHILSNPKPYISFRLTAQELVHNSTPLIGNAPDPLEDHLYKFSEDSVFPEFIGFTAPTHAPCQNYEYGTCITIAFAHAFKVYDRSHIPTASSSAAAMSACSTDEQKAIELLDTVKHH